ncbi:hypothetical protein AAZX31_13G031000 [Glycine max]|uniref:Metacaspase-1 n=1 Tax=Glycine soja TaxID=3848 RepID=A0A0B2S9V4_GLYSO|nr:metacaspase-3-like [Glycine soja]KAG4975922.1 hypothetical protein JHK86_035396 [Glycine max]KAG4958570.1 hypothetical protein JHK87_035203 [Glycine soja]KAG5111995.1 hypothetical protein JHK82_035264 [Glycine max]KHN41488.1 Metacaspase-1 [Glycine soja]RZB70865.1 Metacaspase-1 [Glycine soja]
MASRQERCNQCGILLMVPPEVHVFECAVCHGITQIRPTAGPWSQAYNSFHHLAGRFRGFVNTMMTSSVNSNPSYYGTTHEFGYYPQPPQSLRPSYHVYGSKRAVLCGIRYHGKSYRLKGSVNDVKCMKYFLIKEFGFPSASILMLTDDREERNQLRIPTKYNIQMAMRWLIEGSQSGDSLVFHFSGHGTQEMNMYGDEIDGFDEAICPVDYEEQGKILDDEINAAIVRPLPRGAKLHAIIDACHSGTVLDLAFVCKMNREGYYTWEDQRCPRTDKGTRGGLAICISACEDGQTSIDTSALSGNEATGALTYSFIQTVQNEPGLSYGRLLSAMRSTIRGTKTGIVQLNGPIASLLNRLLGLDLRQEPQLSSSEMFDVYTKRFVL